MTKNQITRVLAKSALFNGIKPINYTVLNGESSVFMSSVPVQGGFYVWNRSKCSFNESYHNGVFIKSIPKEWEII